VTPRRQTELAAQLDALGITPTELAALVGRPVEEVEGWIAKGPDAAAKVRLRFLLNELDAIRRVEQLRRTYSQSLAGDRHDGVTVPYAGGFAGATGGRPE
jgi:hypothetical protein